MCNGLTEVVQESFSENFLCVLPAPRSLIAKAIFGRPDPTLRREVLALAGKPARRDLGA